MEMFKAPYRHRRHKVGLALLEPTASRYEECAKVRDGSLEDEDHWDNGKVGEGFRSQLRAKFDKDCILSAGMRRVGPILCKGAY